MEPKIYRKNATEWSVLFPQRSIDLSRGGNIQEYSRIKIVPRGKYAKEVSCVGTDNKTFATYLGVHIENPPTEIMHFAKALYENYVAKWSILITSVLK